MTGDDRLERQLRFLLEIDKAKSVYRRSYVTGEDRHENDGEHMWHLALFVLVLAEYADEPVDLTRALKLVLLHDIVEIDAGDVFVYDETGRAAKEALEVAAADRIYGLLPDDQRDELRGLWEEFEAGETPESRFARAVDRLAPLLLNYATRGRAWNDHGIEAAQVRRVNEPAIGGASGSLWDRAAAVIDDAVARGYLPA